MNWYQKLVNYLQHDLWIYLGQTLEMVVISAVIAIIFGTGLGLILYFCRKSSNKKINILYKVLDFIVGILRSFPFYVLMFFIVPFTRIVMKIFTGVGEAFSTEAFIVPLTVAAIPFFGKLIESSLIEIDDGVIEAANSLGLSKYQIITKVILKEALPSIISGVTLAVVTLVGYSAMAGAVGGGGLGFFAYDKGYVSYDGWSMFYAVITIIILVTLIQFFGNFLYKQAKKGRVSLLGVGISLCSILIIFGVTKVSISAFSNSDLIKIRVGTMSQPGEPILKEADKMLRERGYYLEIKVWQDFDPINDALVNNEIDANLFQHEPYLNNYNQNKGTNLYNATTMYDALYAGYTKKGIKSLSELKGKSGAKIIVANDSSNLKRCLDLLSVNGVITTSYDDNTVLTATNFEQYIKMNSGYEGVIIEAMSTSGIAIALGDDPVYVGIINATFAINAGLTSDEMVVVEEDLEHKNANILAIREEDKNSKSIQVLVDVLTSDEMASFILEEFNGTIVPYYKVNI